MPSAVVYSMSDMRALAVLPSTNLSLCCEACDFKDAAPAVNRDEITSPLGALEQGRSAGNSSSSAASQPMGPISYTTVFSHRFTRGMLAKDWIGGELIQDFYCQSRSE